jgi:pimeloyl-ACP methyl ester carboxylesterase
MPTTTSNDGTTIAYDRSGVGPALVLVDGATQTRWAGSKPQLARLLADNFSVYTYDRRGRGDSGDTPPYAVEREIDDIAALIEVAGGAAHLYGHSSGGCLALLAAAKLGGPITSLAMYEPPYHIDADGQRRWGTYITPLTDALSGGRRGDAIALFFAYVGMPTTDIERMRQAPFWADLEALAPTLAYDHTAILGPDAAVPIDHARRVSTGTLVMHGERSPSFMADAASAVSVALPDARLRLLPGQDHNVDPAALAPVLIEFLASLPVEEPGRFSHTLSS